jgi:hypothetical protein
MENIREVLERHGSPRDHVIKVTVMMAYMAEWTAVNEMCVTFFPDHLRVHSAFGTTELALGARAELECMALVPKSQMNRQEKLRLWQEPEPEPNAPFSLSESVNCQASQAEVSSPALLERALQVLYKAADLRLREEGPTRHHRRHLVAAFVLSLGDREI